MVANPFYLRAFLKSNACYIGIFTETFLLVGCLRRIIPKSTYSCYGIFDAINLYFVLECNITLCTVITDNDTLTILHQAIFYTIYGCVGLGKGIKSTKQGHQCQSKVNSLHNKMLLKIYFLVIYNLLCWFI